MTYKKFLPTKRFQTKLVLLLCFMLVCISANGCGCGCGNHDQSKSGLANKGSIGMEVTPTELQDEKHTTIVTFVAESKSKRPISLAPYQLQVSFPANTRVYCTSGKQIGQALNNQEKVKLATLLSTEQINTSQDIALTITPDLNLHSLEMELQCFVNIPIIFLTISDSYLI